MNANVLSTALCLSLAALSSTASADTKSWTALKTHFSSSSAIALSVDVAAIKKGTKSLPTLVQQFLDEEKDAKEAFGMLKSICAIDPFDVVSDFSVALDKDGNGLIAIGITGTDEAKLLACATKIVQKQDPKMKIAAKPGKISEYAIMGETLYAMWPSKDVVVFGTAPDKKAMLEAPGAAPSGDLAGYLGKVSTTGVLMAAANIGESDVKAAYGSVALAKGVFTGTGKFIATDAKHGAQNLKEATRELAKGIEKANKKGMTNVAKVLKAIKITPVGDDMQIDGAVAESDLVGLIPALDKVF